MNISFSSVVQIHLTTKKSQIYAQNRLQRHIPPEQGPCVPLEFEVHHRVPRPQKRTWCGALSVLWGRPALLPCPGKLVWCRLHIPSKIIYTSMLAGLRPAHAKVAAFGWNPGLTKALRAKPDNFVMELHTTLRLLYQYIEY